VCIVSCTPWIKKAEHSTLAHNFAKYWPLSKLFTCRLSSDCLIEWSLKIPTRLKRVTTTLWNLKCWKNCSNLLTSVAACPSWAYEQDYQFPRRLKRFSYIRCNIIVLVLIDFSGCDLFCMSCLPKQFVHHSLHPFQKCNNLRDHAQGSVAMHMMSGGFTSLFVYCWVWW